jgi:hypothetical protein
MPVQVITAVASNGHISSVTDHEDGDVAYIKDGHLFVEQDGVRRVAIYAPGKWAAVVVSESKGS